MLNEDEQYFVNKINRIISEKDVDNKRLFGELSINFIIKNGKIVRKSFNIVCRKRKKYSLPKKNI